ncbi:SulP family inorganic anion transporter [Streptomyces sp. 6N223]|uniref:SulP family inorganic anion transporter n=1 Tax=Streptomyces sp. 6N223 TaxID=3457412 RepID=UPI003FCF61DB
MLTTSLLTTSWTRVRPLLPTRIDLLEAFRQPRRDLLAGVTVAVVALPLALGLGISSGMGPAAGLATAVVAGAVAAVFGGSHLQVSGPTGAMTVVLVPIAARHGPEGVLTVGLLAGLLLLALSLLRFGRYVRLIPAPVMAGFTLGIACVIGLQQVPAALGVSTPEGVQVGAVAWEAAAEFARDPNWTALALALGVAAAVLAGALWRPGVPFSILAVAAATLAAEILPLNGVQAIGELPAGLAVPSLSFLGAGVLDPGAFGALLAPAMAIAGLAALESLLSAGMADGMAEGRANAADAANAGDAGDAGARVPPHDPDRELFGQGLANVAAPLVGGIPASGATARTAVNVRAGAVSRLSALVHAAVLAAVICAAAPLVARIPLAALAGVLLATSVRMVEPGSLRAMARATRPDAVVVSLTAVVTVAFDLVYAVILGMLAAGVTALHAVAAQARVDRVALADELAAVLGREVGDDRDEMRLLADHIVVYRLDGPLFFAAAHRFQRQLAEVSGVSAVILRMCRVTTLDASGALALKEAIERLERRGIAVYVSGIREGHDQPLKAIGVIPRLRAAGRVFATTAEAIEAARHTLRAAGTLPGPRHP